MAKNLPPIFKVSNDKIPKTNNKSYFYSKTEEQPVRESTFQQEMSIEEKLDSIFTTRGYSFNIPVTITFAGKSIETFLATRTKSSLITLDNEVIPISTITSLEIKDPIK